jgi:hypothetical protein
MEYCNQLIHWLFLDTGEDQHVGEAQMRVCRTAFQYTAINYSIWYLKRIFKDNIDLSAGEDQRGAANATFKSVN